MMSTTQYHHHHHRNIYQTSSTPSSMTTSTSLTMMVPQSSSTLPSTTNMIHMSNILKPKGQTPDLQTELQILLRENHKLASISRLCIHLVDRCRMLNKSKQFVEDLSRLGSLIDDFNRSNTRKSSQLPTFSNSGLVFSTGLGQNSQTVQSSSSNRASSQKANSMTSMIQNNIASGSGGGNSGNMYLIPISMGLNQQGPQQFQLIQANDTSSTMIATTMSSKGKGKGKKFASSLMISADQQQQSILFKKLTESGQIQLMDHTMIIQQQQSNSGNNQHQQQINIPVNLGTGSDSNSAIFSIVQNQNNSIIVDHSNIENDPDIKLTLQNNTNSSASASSGGGGSHHSITTTNNQQKVFKCLICDKVFANAYNLNRHSKSHSGFQPYACDYPDCSKRFNYNYHLKRHMETHTGARPFVCTWPDCDQRFNRKYNLNRHLWIHAEIKNKSQQQSAGT